MFAHYKCDYTYVPKYSIVENNEKYWMAEYRFGKVYVVKDISHVPIINKNDIVVVDARNDIDPNMEVISSYEIADKEARNDIIEIIMEYERMFPSKWERSIESMRLEWYIHNMLYNIDYERHRTDNVDFDNSDELEYQKPFLNKILKI